MNVVLRHTLGDQPVEMLKQHLTTPWQIYWDGEPPIHEFPVEAADALVAMSFGADDAATLPNLGLLQLPGAGFDRIDFDAVPAQCTVCNAFEHEYGIAEYVFAAMLEWQIGIRAMDAQLRQGIWDKGFSGGQPSHGELRGKTLGLVGYGHIGREVAVRGKAFGMKVAAVTRTPSNAVGLDHVAGMDQLGGLCDEADFLVIACPLTDGTKGLIGAAEFGRMKQSAVLINVARGPVVDEEALFAACGEHQIGGAVIDVWYQYPKDGTRMPSRLRFQDLDNVVMTPHASGWTRELTDRRLSVIGDNLDRLARGEPLRNPVMASQ